MDFKVLKTLSDFYIGANDLACNAATSDTAGCGFGGLID